MTAPLRVFRRSNLYTQCEQCHATVDLTRAGACPRCKRVLCNKHLHGSFFRRLMTDLGAATLCLRCRAESKQ